MKKKVTFSMFLVLALAISACASATPTPTTAAATMPPATMAPATMVPPSTPTGPATVDVAQNSSLGPILVDSAGMTLYLYTKDSPNTSTCFNNCATNWPPLLTNGAPVGGTGTTASMLGTLTRPDGTVQVTYNGWPLYNFVKDKAAGDTAGEGAQSVWYVVTSDGMQK